MYINMCLENGNSLENYRKKCFILASSLVLNLFVYNGIKYSGYEQQK